MNDQSGSWDAETVVLDTSVKTESSNVSNVDSGTELQCTGISDSTNTNLQSENNRKRKISKSSFLYYKTKNNAELPTKKDFYETASNVSDVSDVSCIVVSNFPTHWTYQKVEELVVKHCGSVNNMLLLKDENSKFTGSVRLNFNDCYQAADKLLQTEVDGRKLVVQFADESDNESETEPPTKKEKREDAFWKPESDLWDEDPKGLYGLKPSYLKSLNINPPLDKWVYVTNFRCGYSELREVMELAGHVVSCSVFFTKNRNAKVLYSHPLEAVQAISMLNNQVYYGQALKLIMGRCPPNTVFLPKGLTDIGPGLGLAEKPERDIVRQFGRYVQGQNSTINQSVFSLSDEPNMLLDDLNGDNEGTIKRESIDKAIIAIKELNSRGITTEHLKEALKQLDSGFNRTRKFKVQNVEDIEFENDDTNDSIGSGSSTQKDKDTDVSKQCSPISVSGDFKLQDTIPTKSPANTEVNKTTSSMVSPRSPVVSETGQLSELPGQSTNIKKTSLKGSTSSIASRPFVPPINPVGFTRPNMHRMGSSVPPSNLHSNVSVRVQGSIPVRPALGVPGPRPRFIPSNTVIPPLIRQTFNPMQTTTLQINNLPPSANFGLVSGKLSQSGQVVSLRMPTPGVALAQFATRAQAEDCYKQIHSSMFDGHLITAQFV